MVVFQKFKAVKCTHARWPHNSHTHRNRSPEKLQLRQRIKAAINRLFPYTIPQKRALQIAKDNLLTIWRTFSFMHAFLCDHCSADPSPRRANYSTGRYCEVAQHRTLMQRGKSSHPGKHPPSVISCPTCSSNMMLTVPDSLSWGYYTPGVQHQHVINYVWYRGQLQAALIHFVPLVLWLIAS